MQLKPRKNKGGRPRLSSEPGDHWVLNIAIPRVTLHDLDALALGLKREFGRPVHRTTLIRAGLAAISKAQIDRLKLTIEEPTVEELTKAFKVS